MLLGKKITGLHAVAQEVLFGEEDFKVVDQKATVAVWFIHAPSQSIAWDRYLLSIYHLRPIEGGTPVKKEYDALTHEIVLVALNPDKNPQPNDPESWAHLVPMNLVMQLELPHDEAASDLLERSAKAICGGLLWAEPPMSGMVEPWRTSMLQTSAHYRNEPHAGHNL